MLVPVKQFSHSYELTEYGAFKCIHKNIELVPPCCDGSPDECGRMTCGCYGQYSVDCLNPECTGIHDWQVDELMEQLT